MPLSVLYFLWRTLAAAFHPTGPKVLEIALSSVVSLVLGLLAARQLRVYPSAEGGKAMAAGSLTYFLWWLAAFAIKTALAFAFGESAAASVSAVDVLTPVFLLVATRNLYPYWRARQLGLKLC